MIIPNKWHSIMKHLFVFFTILFTSTLPSLAYDFEVDGIYYNKDVWEDGTNHAVVIHSATYEGDVVIPDSVVYQGLKMCVDNIDDAAFQYCGRLKSVFLPKTIHYIGQGAFKGCPLLSSIVIDPENEWYETRDESNAVVRKKDLRLMAGCRNTKIPDSVYKIAVRALSECSNLTSVTIPSSVVAIFEEAFYKSTELEDVKILEGTMSIGPNAFCECTALRSVTLPNSIRDLGECVFYACHSLESVTSYMEAPVRISKNFFYEISNDAVLHIPAGTRDAYIAAGWDKYFASMEEFDTTTTTYRLLVEEGKRWTYVRTPDHPAYSPYFYEYYLEGDTVIGGQKCLKLFSENEYNDNKVIYKGSLYEEDKKVYAFLPEQGTADLLYDFGCEVDDEICVSEGRMLVTDIIQREYDGMTLRFYNLLWLSDDGMHNVDGCVWVEGIGGLIDFFQTVPTIGSSKWLYRCEVNGEALYRYEYVQPKYTEEDYHEMAIEGKTWNYIHHYIDEKGTHVEEPYSYVVKGDTIIEQKICKKLYYQDSQTERFVCALWETGRDLMKRPSGSDSWQRTYQFGRTDIGRVFDWDSKQGTGRVFWMLHDRDTITVNGMDYYRLTFYSKTIDGGTTGMLTTIEDGPDVWHEIWVEGVGSELNGIEDPVHEKPLNNEDYTRFVSCYEDGVCIFTANDFRMEKPDPATTYRPFIEEGKVWKVGSPDLLGEIYCLDTYYFEGDTIVGNKTCKKMICHTEWKESYGHEPWTGYVGALYEESKRTYIAHPGSQQFVLLYDFAAPVGTTIDFYDGYEQMPSSCLISKKYMSTDSIFHGMVTEIKMYDPDLQLMTSTTYSEWREGVGYNCIQNVYNLNKNTDKETLKSCTVGDEVLYYNPKPIDTITPVGGEVKKQWLDFTHTTKPRPKAPMRSSQSATEEESLTGEYSAKELFVSLQSLSGVYTIRLTDAAGNEVYCKEVQTSNVVALNTDLTQYAEGTYTLTVENAAELYTATLTLPLIDDAVRDLSATPNSNSSPRHSYYTLSGHPLSTPPTRKGVYIRNSRKVLIK
jgi:hypothetical protein